MSRKNTHSVLYLKERGGQLYIDGTTAVQIYGYENADSEFIPALHVVDRERVERRQRHRIVRAIVTWSVMAVVLAAGCLSLFWYIGMHSRVTQAVKEVGTLSAQYEALVTENDERMHRIEQSVDLDAVRIRAITRLGMTYADEGQTIYYVPDAQDSVTQVATVGEP